MGVELLRRSKGAESKKVLTNEETKRRESQRVVVVVVVVVSQKVRGRAGVCGRRSVPGAAGKRVCVCGPSRAREREGSCGAAGVVEQCSMQHAGTSSAQVLHKFLGSALTFSFFFGWSDGWFSNSGWSCLPKRVHHHTELAAAAAPRPTLHRGPRTEALLPYRKKKAGKLPTRGSRQRVAQGRRPFL